MAAYRYCCCSHNHHHHHHHHNHHHNHGQNQDPPVALGGVEAMLGETGGGAQAPPEQPAVEDKMFVEW